MPGAGSAQSSLAQHLWAPTQTEGPRGGVDAARGDVRKQRQALFVAQHFSTLPRLPQLSAASVPGSVRTCAPQRSRSTLKQHLRSWAGLKAWGMIPAWWAFCVCCSGCWHLCCSSFIKAQLLGDLVNSVHSISGCLAVSEIFVWWPQLRSVFDAELENAVCPLGMF